MASTTEYVPGVCNIGPAERRKREQAGWLGLGLTLVLWALFILLRVGAPWRLFLFLPAALGASGFLQSALHFCAAFGMRGWFNFGSVAGKTDTVEQAEFRRLDRNKARLIGLYSALVGLLIAAAGLFIAVPR